MSYKKALTIMNVSKILHQEWDPIGCGVPEDEYERYAIVIVKLLQQRCSEKLISDYLSEVSINMLKYNPNINNINKTIQKFKEYKWV